MKICKEIIFLTVILTMAGTVNAQSLEIASSCATECADRDYSSGYCNTYAVVFEPQYCEVGEVNIGQYGDCTTPGIPGSDKTCCCTQDGPVPAPEYPSNKIPFAIAIVAACATAIFVRKKE